MNILMVLSDNTYPPDIRVEKEAKALQDAGHKLFLICRNSGDQKPQENVHGMEVQRINLRQEFIFDHLTMFLIVFFRIIKTIRKKEIDSIHIHDIPLAFPALLAAKILNRRAVLDLHENYSAMIGYAGAEKRASFPIRIIAGLLEKLEIYVCKRADIIMVVVEEAIARLVNDGVPEDKFRVVSNYADVRKLEGLENRKTDVKRPALVYSGGLSAHRGMDTIIESLAMVNKQQSIYLYIIGGKKEELERSSLGHQIKQLGLEDKVIMTGWVSFEKSIEYVNSCDIAIIPHHRNPHTEATIPHKIFQFMYIEKPILASDVGPLKRVVENTNAGITFKAGDAQDLSKKILAMLDSPEQWNQMGQNGRNAVIEKYNWAEESKNLIKIYGGMA